MKNTIGTVLEASLTPPKAEFIRDLATDLYEITQNADRFSIDEVAVIAAASGLLLGGSKPLAAEMERVKAKRAAAKAEVPANLTSLDL